MEKKQNINVPMDIDEIAMLIASVERSLSGISSRFDLAAHNYANHSKAASWMNENYETVAGVVQMATNTLNIIYKALDENII